MTGKNGAIKLVAGNSNPALAEAIGKYIGSPMTKAVVRRFADMEIFVEIQENVRGADVFVIQSTSYPANDHLMELLILSTRCVAPRRGGSRRSFPITVTPGRTANRGRAPRSRQSSSPISLPMLALTVS